MPAKPRSIPRDIKTLTREDWVAAARDVFILSGIDDVKVDRLARRLKISRGSFYWHFKSRKDLLDALLRDWEARNRSSLDQIRARWLDRKPDMADIMQYWLLEDTEFPMAIRIWARKSKPVAELVRTIDNAWIDLVKSVFISDGQDEMESFVRARVIYFHQIGYYALGIVEDFEERLKLAPYYTLILTGRPAGPVQDRVVVELRERQAQAAKLAKRKRPRARLRAEP